ncbi:MAG: Crp/Fnr family transcriptional regulator [Clostridia bacterium]|nr:Crp/Fnr family transcriptional regulator [Clostridia bacterium]
MPDKQTISVRDLFLFSDIDRETADELLSFVHPQIVEYPKGTTVFAPRDFSRKLGFVLRGTCRVLHCREASEDLPMNILRVGDSFGILSLFCEDEYPTTVLSDGDTRILFFTKEDVFLLIERSATVSRNLLRFLCTRVDFLTRKVQALAAKDALAKLATVLLQTETEPGVPFPFHATTVARVIGCGRASVYRAICTLEDEGAIEYRERKIKILNKKILERISK